MNIVYHSRQCDYPEKKTRYTAA